ncbi:hypothetical protein J42TS3_19830 [Paenibacillus vini]|uniref:Sporulation protein n=1 Tax=Paenibacillus vini TaxID=1476024 RepID=A0ABQ4MAD7_9BACL|nr:hypothetical protein J42TS3_19830 [Paenibacillus vini]
MYEHLKSVTNKSEFISKALDAYISGDKHSEITHDEIRKVVMEILQAQGTLSTALIQPLTPADAMMISEEDVALIADLF